MRIGINTLFLIPTAVGGTESYVRNLLIHLQKIDRENEYVIYTNLENAGTFSLSAPNFREAICEIHAVRRPVRIVYEQFLSVRARQDRLDVLHSPGYTAPLFLRCANVVTLHDMNYHYFPEDWSRAGLIANRILIPLVAKSATLLLTISECSKKAIVDVLKIDPARVRVVYHGIDGNLPEVTPSEIAATLDKFQLKQFLLTVSASHPHKNLDGLLAAYDRLIEKWPDAPTLVVCGPIGQHHKRLLATRTKGRVLITGWLTDKELAALYRSARAFVFPSKYEGFGLPVLEAMSYGIPTVCSNASCLPEIAGGAALLVNPDDHAAIAEAIERACKDEVVRDQLITRGRERAAEFLWEKTARGTLDVYRDALKAHAAR